MMEDLDLDICGLGLTIIDVGLFLVLGINKMARTKKNSRLFKVAIDLSQS